MDATDRTDAWRDIMAEFERQATNESTSSGRSAPPSDTLGGMWVSDAYRSTTDDLATLLSASMTKSGPARAMCMKQYLRTFGLPAVSLVLVALAVAFGRFENPEGSSKVLALEMMPSGLIPRAKLRPNATAQDQATMLVVVTDPSGALVEIAGETVGPSPIAVAKPPRKDILVRISKPGYPAWAGFARPDEGGHSTVEAILTRVR